MPPPRFVELVRVSSRGQAKADTPEDQRRALDQLRRTRPGQLVERIEQQVSGAAAGEDRPDLARLAELAALRAFDEVRVRHLDRLTRHEDPLERAAVLSMVRRAGAVIVDAAGAVLDPATMGGELVWVVSTLASAEERRKIAERTMAGKRRGAAEGRLVSSTPPWGRAFDREKGWSLTAAARDYRRLFELAATGKTLWAIARQLDAEGVASARGRPWTAQMVGNLVRAPHAAGRWRSHGAETQIPAIVTAAVQAAVLARLASHDHSGGRHATHPALLRKVLRCGVCGSPCHTNRNTGARAELYYHCAARGTCYRAHNVAAVDDAAKTRMGAWLRSSGARAAKEAREPGAGAAALREAVASAEKALAALDREEERIGRLGARGGLTERTAAKLLRELATRRREGAATLDDARAQVAAEAQRTEQAAALEARIIELRQGYEHWGFAEWRGFVDLVFPRLGGYHVAIWPDGRLELHGAIPLDAIGEGAVRRAGNRAPPSRTPCRIPVDLLTYARRA